MYLQMGVTSRSMHFFRSAVNIQILPSTLYKHKTTCLTGWIFWFVVNFEKHRQTDYWKD